MSDASKPTLSAADRIAAAASRAAHRTGATATATAVKIKEKVKETPKYESAEAQEIDAKEQAALALKIKENPFYRTLTDTQTSQEEKISAIATALDPKTQTMEKVRENYKAFQEYYTYIQSEELDEALENVKRLIEEIKGHTKVEITKILKDLQGMLEDVNVSRQLIEVLRQSRISGETIKQLSAAVKRNDEIVKELGTLDKTKEEAARKTSLAKAFVDQKISERNEAEGTLSARILGSLPFVRKDTTYSDRVNRASAGLASAEGELKEIDDRIEKLNAERRQDLESGPLKILRSVDEVDDNLSERLIASGNNGINTIQGAQKSVLQLMGRAVFSEGEVDKIARRVADKQITLTVLQSGLQQASSSTNGYKTELEGKSAEAEAGLAAAKAPEGAAEPSIVEVARRKTEAIDLKTTVGEVIDFQSHLNDTISEMEVTLSKTIERQSETDSQKKIIQGTKKSVTILGRDTLNTVAQNLEGVLHNLHADQTDETQQAVVAFARAAEEVKHGTLAGMIQRQGEMHNKDMSLLDDTIKRLKESTDMIADTLEKAVDEGMERADKQRTLKAATDELEKATTTMRKVTGEMSNDSVQDGPSRPANDSVKPATEAPAPRVA